MVEQNPLDTGNKKPRPRSMGMTGCDNCILLSECGGHPLPLIRELGCANYANQTGLTDRDDMDPAFPEAFDLLWNDVGGLFDYRVGTLRPVSRNGLPNYLPLLQHSSRDHSRLLDLPIVALRLFDVVRLGRNGVYSLRYSSGAALRAAYNLRADTEILLVGVDHDYLIERFWEYHRLSGACQLLAGLGLRGITVPNFSFFTCATPFQIMRNRKRLLLSAQRLSAAGVNVAPHLQANTEADWNASFRFLKEHSEISVVTMEFQTGALADHEVGRRAFDSLVALKRKLGRPIHPILVGAARYYGDLVKEFKSSFTVIDSGPFLAAMWRRILVEDSMRRLVWRRCPTNKGASLLQLIDSNIRNYRVKLKAGCGRSKARPISAVGQSDWDLSNSTPYLTAQPVA